MDTIPRIVRIEADDSYSAGVRLGESLGRSFGAYLEDYLAARILAAKNCTKSSETHAVAWINALPQHICDRFRGLSKGSGIPFERIAYWGYLEIALSQGCSSIICRSKGKVWIGHNNDTFVPELWGYITVLAIKGRIPTMYFGLAGDIWATAGINKAKLWLHVDHLRVTDRPDNGKVILPTYGFIVEALETCETIDDVRSLLNKIDRTEGMILIAADGKTDEAAIFECSCSKWRLSESQNGLGRENKPRHDRTREQEDRKATTRHLEQIQSPGATSRKQLQQRRRPNTIGLEDISRRRRSGAKKRGVRDSVFSRGMPRYQPD